MSNSWKIDLKRREKLETAWEYYSDLIAPGHNYRGELRELRLGSRSETPEETKKRLRLLDQREDSLKRQFLSYIPDGFFYVFGCELSSATATHDATPINHKLFDQNLSGFKITWEQSCLEVLGRTFIGLEFQPNIEVIQDAWSGHDFSQEVEGFCTDEVGKLSGAIPANLSAESNRNDAHPEYDHKQKYGEEGRSTLDDGTPYAERSGAKSLETMRQDALIECLKRYSDFSEWKVNAQISRANKIAHELFPNKFHGRGISRSSYYTTKDILTKTGVWPSKNIQK